MRREWVDTVDVYNGLGGTNPGLYRGTITGRIVVYQYRSLITPPFNEVIGYFTYFSNLVRAGTMVIDPPYFKLDPQTGSRVVRVSDGYEFHILWRELITPRVGGSYFRGYFIP